MRLMISGGGTGGHVYPALAVAKALNPATEVVWVGSQTGMEKELVEKAGIPYRGISAGGLRGKNPLAAAQGLFRLGRGYRQSRQLLARFRPDALFVTGGYVCVPTTLAARRAGIPILIYLPDIQPGQAIKFLSRFADAVAVTAPPAQQYFPAGLTLVAGYPAREELYQIDRQAARSRLNLDPARPTLLVMGGSQGARSINKAVARPEALSKLLAKTQLIHLSGQRDAGWTAEIRQNLPDALKQHYHLFPYLHREMADALAAADLIVSRAGASILGEAPAVGAPSILSPYPYGGAHQWPNAQYLAGQGAAVIVPDAELEKSLVKTALALLANPEQRSAMAGAARKLARPDAARTIASKLEELSHGYH